MTIIFINYIINDNFDYNNEGLLVLVICIDLSKGIAMAHYYYYESCAYKIVPFKLTLSF